MPEPRNCYRIKNMVRSVTSRVQRQGATTRHRAALYIIGRRVLPNVPLMLSPAEFEKHKMVLISKVVTGEISITRPDNVRIDSLNDGTLIYFPPNKPATLQEPPMGMAEQLEDVPAGPTGATGPCGCPTGPQGEPGPVGDEAALTETPGPAELDEAAVKVPSSDKITAELPIPDEEGPRLCTKCRERPVVGGTITMCEECLKTEDTGVVVEETPVVEAAPEVAPEEAPVQEAAPAEPEAAPEVVPAEPAVEPAVETDRKPRRKGKKS